MGLSEDVALWLSADLREVLADVQEALEALDRQAMPPPSVRKPLLRAYKALAGRDWSPR